MLFKRPAVRFCPKCRGTRLSVRYLDPFSLQPKYLCRGCGFSSFIVPERESGKKEAD